MSERYTRLFSLSENLYSVGSPIIVAAGTLLKDNQTGKIVAQLKLRSISSKMIIGVKVRLCLFDNAGNPIGVPVDYDYLDLSISRDIEFGQKTPVPIAESKARSYAVAVQEVVFADKTTWTTSNAPWESLPRQKTLDAVFGDSELAKQYRIAVESNFSYYPLQEKDLWYCTCSALNHEDEDCHTCHRTLFELQSIDLEQLAKDKDIRLEQERQAAEAKAAAEKAAAEARTTKIAAILKIAVPSICAVIAISLLATKVIIPNSKYNDAVAQMEAKKYEEAIVAFEALESYKDSSTMADETRKARIYDHAYTLMESATHNSKETATLKDRVQEEVLAEWKRQESIRKAMSPGSPAVQSPDFWIPTDKEIENIGEYTADELFAMECYGIAESAFQFLDDYADSTAMAQTARTEIEAVINTLAQRIEDAKAQSYAAAKELATNGKSAEAAIAFGKLGDYQDSRERSIALWNQVIKINAIVASYSHTVGLKQDGTVVAIGATEDGRCNVSRWEDFVAISSINAHTVGLKDDGTVVSVGRNENKQCAVSCWRNIVAIATGSGHTVGLRNDGTVVAVGYNDDNRCDVSDWTNIVGIAAGYYHTVGLTDDGTVLTAGTNNEGQCNVSTWKDITEIFAGGWHTVGLRADGTVIAVGCNDNGRCDVSDWSDIVSIAAGKYHTVGLKSDGTVVAVGQSSEGQCDVSDWNDIVAISAGAYHTVGLKSDGTVVAVGWNKYGQCDVSTWKDIKLPK